jgi:hypothetical protein
MMCAMNYYIAHIARNKSRTYLDSNGKFQSKLYRNKSAGTLKFKDAEAALLLAAEHDALVLTEGAYGLVTI